MCTQWMSYFKRQIKKCRVRQRLTILRHVLRCKTLTQTSRRAFSGCACDCSDASVSTRWVIFNDQKVCASEKPPKDMGYLYFYRRVADWGAGGREAWTPTAHDLVHSRTPPTALRTLHQWQSCKYISQMTYKHCSINWCKCKKKQQKSVWLFDVSFSFFYTIRIFRIDLKLCLQKQSESFGSSCWFQLGFSALLKKCWLSVAI